MRLFTPETNFTRNFVERARFLLAWRIAILFLILFTPLAIIYYIESFVGAGFYATVAFLSIGALIYMKMAHRSRLVYWLFSVACSMLTILSLMLPYATVHYAEFIWSSAIVIFSFIGLGRKAGVAFMLLMTIAIAIHVLFFLNPGIVVLRQMSQTELVGTTLELTVGMASMAYLMRQYLIVQRYSENQLVRANSELEEQNRLIKRKNEENEILAKEVHHRVKNNLQIIISLLRMQRDEIHSPETKAHFSEAISRIMTMSLIHEKLYKEKEMELVNLEEYTRDLVRAIVLSDSAYRNVDIRVNSTLPVVGLKTIVPLGLLLNELLTNSLKHAFDEDGGTIDIDLSPSESGSIRMLYSDSGVWKSSSEVGFGTELIEVLTHQLEGKVSRNNTTYEFELSNLDHL